MPKFTTLLTGAMVAMGMTLGVAATPAQAGELIVNGGFEDPNILSPSQGGTGYQTISGGFTGWTVNSGNIDIVDHYNGGNAGQGDQWLDLWGDQSGAISQTFNTVLGQVYTFSFLYGNNPYSTSNAAATFSLGALLSGTVASSSGLNFQLFSQNFVGTGAPVTLSFVNTVGGNNGGLALDAVSVTTAVPEPATWGLIILGFGAMGAALRRRRPIGAALAA